MDINQLSKRMLPLLCLTAYFSRLFFITPTLVDASVLAIFAILTGYLEWKLDNSELIRREAQLKGMEEKMAELDHKVSTIRIAQGFNNNNLVRK